MSTVAELFDRAVRHHQSGDLAAAAVLYRQILQAEPGHANALNNLGYAYFEKGQVAEALVLYRQALRCNPNLLSAHNNLGFALYGQGNITEAIDCFQQALGIDPNHPDPLNNLGMALDAQGRLDEACACYRQALRSAPNHVDAHNNLGVSLMGQRNLAEAAECFLQALRFNPNFVDAHSNLGVARMRQGNLDEAAQCFQKTLALDPGHPPALWTRSLLYLLQGNYEKAWFDYEQRWAQPGKARPHFEQPLWDGAPLNGKRILIYTEQGLGDTIQFLRFVKPVKERGGHVLLECSAVLQGLVGKVVGVDQVIVHGQARPAFDVQLSLMSLPGLFGITLANLPNDVPYVRPNPELVAKWRGELTSYDGFKVGIVWQGNPQQEDDPLRSVPLEMFTPLAEVPGVRLFSLQVGQGTEQLANVRFPIIDLGRRFDPHSLEDAAAVLLNLDLVVTVCTSMAHLAGALGVPGWVALKYSPYWCWLLNRSDSPWYPSLRLFRQKQPGAWDGVFESIKVELARIIENKERR